MPEDRLLCEEIRCEHLIQDRWIDLRRSAYRFPDGRVFEPYYSFTRRDYAVIVATDEAGNVLCVRQFRQGIRKVTTEFPAGGIEWSDGAAHTPEQALARECREELLLGIEAPRVITSVIHRYPSMTIRLILVECRARPGSVPVPQEGQAVGWYRAADLDSLPLCPADRELIPFVFPGL